MTEKHAPEEHLYARVNYRTAAELPPNSTPLSLSSGQRYILPDCREVLVNVAYRDQPCGCQVIGTGTLQQPFDIKYCPMHAQASDDGGAACPATVRVLQNEADALETWRRALAPLVVIDNLNDHPVVADVLEGMGISLTKLGAALQGETERMQQPQWKTGKVQWLGDGDSKQRFVEVLNHGPGGPYVVALVACDEDDLQQAQFLQMVVGAPEIMAIAQEVQDIYLSLADAITVLSHHDDERANMAIEILDELHQHTRAALITAAMEAQGKTDFPLSVRWIIPTYDPEHPEHKDEDYDWTKLHTLTLRNDMGLRVVMGDPKDPISPDVCIERTPDRWRVFVHADHGDPEYIIEITMGKPREIIVMTDRAGEPPIHTTRLSLVEP